MEDDMRTEFSTFSDILKEQHHCLDLDKTRKTEDQTSKHRPFDWNS